MSHNRSRASEIMAVLKLDPLPYPVLLILALIFIFLGFQWFSFYESIVESSEESMGWLLLLIPLLIIFAARWVSTVENSDWVFWGNRRRTHYPTPSSSSSEGSSPWGVAALILVLLVMVQYQSSFLESWFV